MRAIGIPVCIISTTASTADLTLEKGETALAILIILYIHKNSDHETFFFY
jgi:hypothetical protein